MQGFKISNSCKLEHLVIAKSYLFWGLVAGGFFSVFSFLHSMHAIG